MPHDRSSRPLSAGLLALALTGGLTLVQVIGGLLSGSLALIADALHNAAQVLRLALAHGTRRLPPEQMPAGQDKVETLSALIRCIILITLGLYLIRAGIGRISDPQPVSGWGVIALALVALIVDAITAAMTFHLPRKRAAIRAAVVHMLPNAAGSIAILLAGGAMLIFGWSWIDPLVTLGIAGYILWLALGEVADILRTAILGPPRDIDPQAVGTALRAVPGVVDLYTPRLRRLHKGKAGFNAHLALNVDGWTDAVTVRDYAKQVLAEQFSITDAMLDIEPYSPATPPEA